VCVCDVCDPLSMCAFVSVYVSHSQCVSRGGIYIKLKGKVESQDIGEVLELMETDY